MTFNYGKFCFDSGFISLELFFLSKMHSFGISIVVPFYYRLWFESSEIIFAVSDIIFVLMIRRAILNIKQCLEIKTPNKY